MFWYVCWIYAHLYCWEFQWNKVCLELNCKVGSMIELGVFTWVIGLIGTTFNMFLKRIELRKEREVPIWSIRKLKLCIFFIFCQGVERNEVGVERQSSISKLGNNFLTKRWVVVCTIERQSSVSNSVSNFVAKRWVVTIERQCSVFVCYEILIIDIVIGFIYWNKLISNGCSNDVSYYDLRNSMGKILVLCFL